MPTITRRFEWDAGHRILNHESRCRYLHGHRYRADVTVSSKGLDSLGRVIDFGCLKELIGGWIDEYWDHNLLLNSEDPLLTEGIFDVGKILGRDPYIFKDENPTAEVLAASLFHVCCGLMVGRSISIVRVRLFETPNCWADFPSLVGPERHE